MIECSLLNSYILASLTINKKSKKDFLFFHLDVDEGLIGNFSSRKTFVHPRSSEYMDLERLNPNLGHWPISTKQKLECVVCCTKRAKLHLTRRDLWHESRVKCSHCGVHLCIEEDRQCYTKYHTHTFNTGYSRQHIMQLQ